MYSALERKRARQRDAGVKASDVNQLTAPAGTFRRAKPLVVGTDARPHANRIVSKELFCCLANKCAGVQKVYGDLDRRRAARPKQHEDYCMERACRYGRDQHSAVSACASHDLLSGNSTMQGQHVSCTNCSDTVCTGCTAAVQPCPPQVPAHNRFRRNVISSKGKWIDGYKQQQERHHLLVDGAARDLIIYRTLAQWKNEIDQGYPSTGCSNDCPT